MSQFRNPAGLFGRLLARGMAWGHKDFYKNTAKVLDLKAEDKYLEIGFGSGLFIRRYASHVAIISGKLTIFVTFLGFPSRSVFTQVVIYNVILPPIFYYFYNPTPVTL